MNKNPLFSLLIVLSIVVNAQETISWTSMRGEKSEIRIPSKFVCTQKVIVGVFKDASQPNWTPSTVKIEQKNDFSLTIDRVENFKKEDRENCELVEARVFDTKNKSYLNDKKLGYKLCAVKNYYLHPKNYSTSSMCTKIAWQGATGVYCNDFVFNITEREFVEIPTSDFVMISGSATLTQGTCTPLPN